MPSLSSEAGAVQYPLIKYATEVGWEQISQEEALRFRRGVTSPIFWDVFIDRVQALNPTTIDHNKAEDIAKKLIKVPPSIEGTTSPRRLPALESFASRRAGRRDVATSCSAVSTCLAQRPSCRMGLRPLRRHKFWRDLAARGYEVPYPRAYQDLSLVPRLPLRQRSCQRAT